jgi:hypothetical protein
VKALLVTGPVADCPFHFELQLRNLAAAARNYVAAVHRIVLADVVESRSTASGTPR